MANTLLTRISKLEQYNKNQKTILWNDDKENRWINIYGQLREKDNAIFIGDDVIYIGIISQINNGISILCNNIREFTIKNDQFLQIHEIYPELISRVKAAFQPFIHPKEININNIIDAIQNNRFVSFYIFRNVSNYNEIKQSLKENDRVILLNNNNQLENVKLHNSNGLMDFPNEDQITINVIGLTLQQILEINKKFVRKSPISNNVNRIVKIIEELENKNSYKFKTFFSYYDALYNKMVYGNIQIGNNDLKVIILQIDENVYKISMSSNSFDDEAFSYFNENNLIVVHKSTNAIATNSQTQSEIFSTQMKIGDYFYMCRGNNNLEVIGKIISDASDCEYEKIEEDTWQRSYEIIAEVVKEGSYNNEQKWWAPNFRSTCVAIPKNEIKLANEKIFNPFFNAEFQLINGKSEVKKDNLNNDMNSKVNMPLNQILYGPPGTGKTYCTVDKAISIANPEFDFNQKREKIREEFDRLVKIGQIVFTTFHQSMSYEDFIEGIKPETIDNKITYRIKNGIFKNLCETAQIPNQVSFNSAYENLKKDLSETDIINLKTPTDKEFSISLNSNNNLNLHTGINKEKQGSITKENLQKQLNGEDKFIGWEGYFKGIIDYLKNKFNYSEELIERKPNYVLIIDEINRGNVSQIFGELITLIEEDKRLGNKEALEITLPYSKETFGVPPNLYIIGTMNTADRSVEALDTALRRRFSFEEMSTNYELLNYNIGEYKVKDILKIINDRIEKLLDKDHLIGHSYFMNLEGFEKLKSVFDNKVIPLLQEYFYGDFGKMGLVLGKGFVGKKQMKENIFADTDYENKNDFDERDVYEIVCKDFNNALKLLLRKNQNNETE